MLALAILTPSYSMINSKMIVCTVANMQPVMEYTTFALFSTFYINKHKFEYALPEAYVALGIFIFEGFIYATFVYATITQITKFLDINCLYLKDPADASAVAGANGEAESTQASPKDTKKTKKTPSKTSAKAKAQEKAKAN